MKFLLFRKLPRLIRLWQNILTRRHIQQKIPDFNSENYLELILMLFSFDTPLTVNDLVVHLQIKKSRVIILIEDLNKHGYTSARVNTKAKNEHFIFLTKKGQIVAPAIQQVFYKADGIIHKHVDPRHLIVFNEIINQILKTRSNHKAT